MLESNPTNKHMLAKAQGLKFLLHLAHQSDEAVAPYYFRLIALLGMYDILKSQVSSLPPLPPPPHPKVSLICSTY